MSSVLPMQSKMMERLQVQIVGVSKEVERMREFARKAAGVNDTLLIRGETGSGKDNLAECIHGLVDSDHKFVPVDCGSIPENLWEGELFGYSEGAFTDAKNKAGLISVADKGTLFLNELANMGPTGQAKFLRFSESKTTRRIGETKEIPMNARIIAATNANIEELIKSGKFREDLYYRLNVITFTISPLREHLDDVPVLADYFLKRERSLKKFSVAAMELMMSHRWPGNVRELKNIVKRANFSAGDREVIDVSDLNDSLGQVSGESAEPADSAEPQIFQLPKHAPVPLPTGEVEISFAKTYQISADMPYPDWETLSEDFLKSRIIELLGMMNGNQTKVAKMLGITRGKLRDRMSKFKISTHKTVDSGA